MKKDLNRKNVTKNIHKIKTVSCLSKYPPVFTNEVQLKVNHVFYSFKTLCNWKKIFNATRISILLKLKFFSSENTNCFHEQSASYFQKYFREKISHHFQNFRQKTFLCIKFFLKNPAIYQLTHSSWSSEVLHVKI